MKELIRLFEFGQEPVPSETEETTDDSIGRRHDRLLSLSCRSKRHSVSEPDQPVLARLCCGEEEVAAGVGELEKMTTARGLRVYAAAALAALFASGVTAQERPNVLLIMTDNQSPNLLGAYGNRDIRTPNIDQLARDGLLFAKAYATSGVCSPSRAVLMTGLIPSANGVHNGLPARYTVEDYAAIEEFRNLPQTLADAGYYTGLVGKYHLGRHEKPQLGFQWWTTFRGGHTSSFIDAQIFDNGETYNVLDRDEHLTDFWSRRAVDFLAHYKAEESGEGAQRPFFLWLSYNGPYILPPTVNQPPVSRHADYYRDNVPAMPQNRVHPYMREWARNNTAPRARADRGRNLSLVGHRCAQQHHGHDQHRRGNDSCGRGHRHGIGGFG